MKMVLKGCISHVQVCAHSPDLAVPSTVPPFVPSPVPSGD